MIPHPYLCNCQECNYERVVKLVREKYRMASNNQEKYETFMRAYGGDPFPPTYYTDTASDRFKVNKPPYETRSRVRYPGQYRRVQDQAIDVINFQYKPWPDHEWVTYFTVTTEQLAMVNPVIGKYQFIKNADAALRERRFYKIERVDQTA